MNQLKKSSGKKLSSFGYHCITYRYELNTKKCFIIFSSSHKPWLVWIDRGCHLMTHSLNSESKIIGNKLCFNDGETLQFLYNFTHIGNKYHCMVV